MDRRESGVVAWVSRRRASTAGECRPMSGNDSDLARSIEASRREPAAFEELVRTAYESLKGLAEAKLRGDRLARSIQATALVNEACLRLLAGTAISFEGRTHFVRVAAEAMRRVLVDHARRSGAAKRGGGRGAEVLEDAAWLDLDPSLLLGIDEALTALERDDPTAAEVVRLRFFAGLAMEEIATTLGLSERSVRREWAYARARLRVFLEGDKPEATP